MKPLIGTELKRFLRDYKRQNRPNRDLSILLQSVEYPANVGSIFRLADGADVSELLLTGITPAPPHPTIDKIGRYKSERVRWRYIESALNGIEQVKNQGYEVIALELTDSAVPYFQYDYKQRVCLVAGNEDHGVTKSTLAVCDGSVFIPMYGSGRSHNVHAALAIVLYHILHVH
ncbi:MAG TPA: TrmH family RNA methyltransferase [Patescibacteria group bacterium]|jgi:23S rRNA (guanosine2251-2'-O)-methyltransferase|nr:TrmH family RNA methyltransferase [Patescibacteria group bacterium]